MRITTARTAAFVAVLMKPTIWSRSTRIELRRRFLSLKQLKTSVYSTLQASDELPVQPTVVTMIIVIKERTWCTLKVTIYMLVFYSLHMYQLNGSTKIV